MEKERVVEIDKIIKEKFHKYKELYSEVSVLTNEIKKLEEEKSNIIEKDGRRLIFKRPIIELKEFNEFAKNTKWCEVFYENFEENKNDYIVDEAMIVSVYSSQVNYMSIVSIIISFDGYLSKEEYEKIRLNNSRVPEYYRKNKGDGSNGRTKI
jgi:predicted nuclease with TOPRIM domain